MIHTDSSFIMGKGHKICQDYSFHGSFTSENGDVLQVAVVSDGCSGSAHTDIGARILALSLVRSIVQYHDLLNRNTGSPAERRRRCLPLLESIVIRDAAKIARLQGLPETCLDATLMATVSDRDRTTVMAWGDGMIDFRCRHPYVKEDACYLLRNEGAAPYYLSYLLESGRDRKYRETYSWPDSFEVRVEPELECNTPTLPVADERVSFYREFDHADCAPFTITLCSDGVSAFADAAGRAVPVRNLCREITDFKNLHGEFVQRRLSRFIRTCTQRDWTFIDDISVAAVVVEVES